MTVGNGCVNGEAGEGMQQNRGPFRKVLIGTAMCFILIVIGLMDKTGTLLTLIFVATLLLLAVGAGFYLWGWLKPSFTAWNARVQEASATSQQERGVGIGIVGIKQKFGLAGSIVLFIGVFTPMVSLPIVGSMNFFNNGQGDGVFVLLLAVISFVLTVRKQYRWLWVTGLLSLGLLLFTFVNVQMRISEAQSKMQSNLTGNPFKGIAGAAMQSVQIQWGWAVLVVGAALIIAAAAIREDTALRDDVANR
jgi:hypothetical protein